MTVLEALKLTVDKLEGIQVPIKQMQQIGAPIGEAIAMIQASVSAMEAAEAAEHKDEPQGEEG